MHEIDGVKLLGLLLNECLYRKIENLDQTIECLNFGIENVPYKINISEFPTSRAVATKITADV